MSKAPEYDGALTVFGSYLHVFDAAHSETDLADGRLRAPSLRTWAHMVDNYVPVMYQFLSHNCSYRDIGMTIPHVCIRCMLCEETTKISIKIITRNSVPLVDCLTLNMVQPTNISASTLCLDPVPLTIGGWVTAQNCYFLLSQCEFNHDCLYWNK